MIRVKALTGPYKGRVREMPEDIQPADLLASFVQHGWEWKVDYSQASEDETVRWMRADLMARVVRAVQQGRPVRFLGMDYNDAQAVEDAIAGSGLGVSIAYDDERGVEISAHGLPVPEPEKFAALRRAQKLVAERRPEASEEKKDAFARAMAELVGGLALGTAGGPSVREVAAVTMYGGRKWKFQEVAELLLAEDGPIFGPLADLHRQAFAAGGTYDNDPGDIRELTGKECV